MEQAEVKLQCKNCDKFIPLKNKEEQNTNITNGLCSLPESYFPVQAENPCCFLVTKTPTCKDCSYFVHNDPACAWAQEENEICDAFIDINEDMILDIFFQWLKQGKYSRAKIQKLCEEFEQTETVQFVLSQIGKIPLK